MGWILVSSSVSIRTFDIYSFCCVNYRSVRMILDDSIESWQFPAFYVRIPGRCPHARLVQIVRQTQYRRLFLANEHTVRRIPQFGHKNLLVSTARYNVTECVVHQQRPHTFGVHMNRLYASLLAHAPQLDCAIRTARHHLLAVVGDDYCTDVLRMAP